ncbi:vWA domain-containing protein [Zhouia amylolytica]|uniref:VWA domain-containing protein n=1 Tax=Zhouia amylolytica AD3 TaxID=1286632 RepID=W2UNG9_9FLAO|nr:VWA domain-containing protein [Zhouia amylolytica]ETN95548.1 hypothetical protein P278_12700 [Zhouia amylolytica AD3]
MHIETVLLLILAAVIALLTAVFQYIYKKKSKSSQDLLFAFLRFLSVFSLLVLLISPEITTTHSFITKKELPVLIDNSESIRFLGQGQMAKDIVSTLKAHKDLNDKYNVVYYSFSDELNRLDSLNFEEKQTNITKALSQLLELQDENKLPVVLISDGNQTYGYDYNFYSRNYPNSIFSVVIGDTTKHQDIRIDNINVNKYAFLNNTYPVEIITSYKGENEVPTVLKLYNENKLVYSKAFTFSETNNSNIFTIELPAVDIGVQRLLATLTPFEKEQNKTNNTRHFAIEVIDQKTNIAIVTDIRHPDIGALKRSITSNEQRAVDVVEVDMFSDEKAGAYQILILFNPTNKFEKVYRYLKNTNKNAFTITGTSTDWSYLNKKYIQFERAISFDTEEVLPIYNEGYQPFIFEDIGFDDFPPLHASFGDLNILGALDVLLNTRIGNVNTDTPLLVSFEEKQKREIVLFGEGIWQWRAKSFRDQNSFEPFDRFMGGLIQYLSSSNDRDRLNLNFNSFYYGNNQVSISATYFDKNYVFDNKAQLQIVIRDDKNEVNTIPMLLKNNYFEVDLSALEAGDYNFTVTSLSDKISKSGKFTILEYNAEEQFTSANYGKLKSASEQTSAQVYLGAQVNDLIEGLIQTDTYKPIYKTEEIKTPLIEWEWILFFLTAVLAMEWFLRKYNGLI